MRALASSALLVAIAAGTIACGSSRSGAPSRHPAGVSRSRAIAFAHAVNLRDGDVPGMEASAEREPNGQVVSFQLTPHSGCGAADSGERFDFYSPSFRRPVRGRRVLAGGQVPLPAEGLHSKISVLQTAAEQERDFSSLECDRAHPQPSEGKTKVERLASPLSGVRVLAQRTSRIAPLNYFGTRNTTIYTDGFRFVVGPAEILLGIMSAPRPPSAELERRLLQLLYSRAKANAL